MDKLVHRKFRTGIFDGIQISKSIFKIRENIIEQLSLIIYRILACNSMDCLSDSEENRPNIFRISTDSNEEIDHGGVWRESSGRSGRR